MWIIDWLKAIQLSYQLLFCRPKLHLQIYLPSSGSSQSERGWYYHRSTGSGEGSYEDLARARMSP